MDQRDLDHGLQHSQSLLDVGQLPVDWGLAAILAVGVALRLAAIVGYDHSPASDELAYLSMATSLVDGQRIVDNYGNYAMFNVGYPLLVLSPIFATIGINLLAVKLVNLILGLVSIVLCFLAAKQAGAGRIGQLIAAAAWAIYLPTGVYGVYVAKENLMIPLVLGVVWCALRIAKRPSWRVAAMCGLLFGALALTGNSGLSLAGMVGLALLFARVSVLERAGLGVLMLSCALIVSAPWMIRNDRLFGSPILNTQSGFNLYLGNNPAATGWFMSIADTPRGTTWNELRKTAGEMHASEILKRDAMSWISDHPAHFISLAFRKAVYFWMPPIHEGEGLGSTIEIVIRVAWAIQYLIVLVVVAVSLWLLRSGNRSLIILWIGILSYTAVHMLFYVIFRYREPVMPLLMIIFALVLEPTVSSWLERPVENPK